MPERIQLRRTKGWRKPPGAIVVARPSMWGNPYTAQDFMQKARRMRAEGLDYTPTFAEARAMAAEAFRADIRYGPDSAYWWFGKHTRILDILGAKEELRGHDLACWCPLADEHGNRVPCHADVLLEIANA
ncbi:DUF4326 domain-containing protein [Nocardia asiatica]